MIPIASALKTIKTFTWVQRALHATDDDSVAAATARAEIVLANDQPYTQDYAIFVRSANGRITEWREYIDPVRAGAALRSLQD